MRRAAVIACLVSALAVVIAVAIVYRNRCRIEAFRDYTTYGGDVYGYPVGTALDSKGLRCVTGDPSTCPEGQACHAGGFCGQECVLGDPSSCHNPGHVCHTGGACGPECDSSDPSSCPSDQRCHTGGLCGPACDPSSCPVGQLCENGTCAPRCTFDASCRDGQFCDRESGRCECPEGKALSEAGDCRAKCGEFVQCQGQQTCQDGLCACPPEQCSEGMERNDGDCACECKDGYKPRSEDEGGGCVKCAVGEACGETEPARRVMPQPEGCGKSWPVCGGAALIEGRVIRLYEDAIPCKIRSEFNLKMANVFDFESALRECASKQKCDGVWVCDSTLSAIGFSFVDPGGKAENGSSHASGNATFLKDGAGDCGPRGRPQRFGECAPLSAFPSAMQIDQKAGTVVYKDHSFCEGEQIPFQNTGLQGFNFGKYADGTPDLNTMILRKDSDALLCKQLCKLDVRCDAVETTENTCRLYHRRFGVPPALRSDTGVDTTFLRLASGVRITRLAVLREMADPADHGEEGGEVRHIPNLFTRVWDQYDDEARVENLLHDGLLEGHEYTLTTEGSVASTSLTVTVRWDDSVGGVQVDRSAEPIGGFVPVKGISAIRFTAPRGGHLREFIWIEDENKRRSQQAVGDKKLGEPIGTATSVRSGTINMHSQAGASAVNMAHGIIVVAGPLAARENAKKLPSASAVMEALQLYDVAVEKTGSQYRWRPLTKARGWKQGDGRRILKDLRFPAFGAGSLVAIFAGPSAGDLVPISRISGEGAENISVPTPPAGYDAWFATADASTKTNRADLANPTTAYCATKCDEANASAGGDVKCTAFRVTAGGCDLMEWDPSAGTAREGESGGLLFSRSSVSSETAAPRASIQAAFDKKPGADSEADAAMAIRNNFFPEASQYSKVIRFMALDLFEYLFLDSEGGINEYIYWLPVVPCTRKWKLPLYHIQLGDYYLDASSPAIKSAAKMDQILDVNKESYSFAIITVPHSYQNKQMITVIVWNPYFEKALGRANGKTTQWVDFATDQDPNTATDDVKWVVTARTPYSPIYSAYATGGTKKGCVTVMSKTEDTIVKSEHCAKDFGGKYTDFQIIKATRNPDKYFIKSRKDENDTVNIHLCRRDVANTFDVDAKLMHHQEPCLWSITEKAGYYQFQDFEGRFLKKQSYDAPGGLVTSVDGSKQDTMWILEHGLPAM